MPSNECDNDRPYHQDRSPQHRQRRTDLAHCIRFPPPLTHVGIQNCARRTDQHHHPVLAIDACRCNHGGTEYAHAQAYEAGRCCRVPLHFDEGIANSGRNANSAVAAKQSHTAHAPVQDVKDSAAWNKSALFWAFRKSVIPSQTPIKIIQSCPVDNVQSCQNCPVRNSLLRHSARAIANRRASTPTLRNVIPPLTDFSPSISLDFDGKLDK